MISSRAHTTTAVLALGALVIAACSGGQGADEQQDSATATTQAAAATDQSDDEAPIVVVTTSIWADVASNVACDGLARLETIIPPGGDPHSFEPSLRDRETMDNADLVVANGLFLEESLSDAIEAVEDNGVTVLRVGDELEPLTANTKYDDHSDTESESDDHSDTESESDDHSDTEYESDDHSDTEYDDHDEDHGGFDPHVWWDPTRVARAVALIANALADTGVDRTALDACTTPYIEELTTLDDEIAGIVDPLSPEQRILVTNHDSLGYFADRYGFEVLGSVIPSSSSLAATSPAELDALAADIESTGVSAIFADTQSSSNDADALADRIGDVEVVSLLTGTLDEPGSEAGTYTGWLRQNAEAIVDALTRTAAS